MGHAGAATTGHPFRCVLVCGVGHIRILICTHSHAAESRAGVIKEINMTKSESSKSSVPLPASSPCAMHEFEDYEPQALIALLNDLIEGERAGARGLLEMAAAPEHADLETLLRDVAEDEARFCVMLSHHVERLGGQASRLTGVFAEKLSRREGLDAKIALLDKGQSAVVQMLEEMIPRIADADLRADLTAMRDVHIVNIERCNSA